ncbi:MAG: hypothetical protein ACHQUC_11005 [Chlamydiales bacterium]
MFASSVSSFEGSIEGSVIVAKKLPIHLLKWEECDTVGKKIGFVVGSAINWTVLTTDKIINKAVQIFHLDTIGRFCLRILKSIREVVSSCVKKIWGTISPHFNRTTLRPIGPGKVHVKPEGFSSKIQQVIVDTLKSIYDFFAPIFNKISDHVKDGIEKCKPTFRKIADWTIVPFYDHVLSPVGTIIKDIFYGAFSGLLKKKEDESEATEVSTDSHPSVPSTSKEHEVPEDDEIEFNIDDADASDIES